MQAKYSFPIKFYIKEETYGYQMPHGRYLITDQVGIFIDRGFDLLWDDNRMRNAGLDITKDDRRIRDVMIGHTANCSAVESNTRKMTNL